MKVLYKLKVSLMHKSSLFQLNRMTQKSKLYLFTHAVPLCNLPPMLWKKNPKKTKKKNNHFSDRGKTGDLP